MDEPRPALPQKHACFRFEGELNDFLAPRRRGGTVMLAFRGAQSVKHLVESLGAPHTEVGAILVGGAAVVFDYIVQDGDQVSVYPLSAQGDGLSPGAALAPPGEARFVLDNHLGRLAAYLRMLGFDTLYRNDYQDGELAAVCHEQDRILLTRDRRLLMRNSIACGYCVRSKNPRQQLAEVVGRYRLAAAIAPFKRCIRCNGVLRQARKQEVLHLLEPLTRQYFDEFQQCPECGQVYWKGSHHARMLALIQSVLPET
ncbi:MAG: Mut7-C RNAse domain-containing protein [Anaerolineales bacterium]|nr:Mut7-C RNAse domain-containing protein [Anaerolineales bacterium]